jgi:hypothetical protein
MTILQKGRLGPSNRTGDQVVKANGRADVKGTRNVMQAERILTTRSVSLCFAKPVFMIASQVLLANAARQNYLCLSFFYDIYDSPHPATFRRVLDGSAEPQTPPISSGREMTPPSVSSIHITAHSELQPGSTGIVHIGTMAVDQSGPAIKVAVKLAFSRNEKSRLIKEHQIYSHLHSRGVQGIPCDIGLFVDEEPLLGAEGPYVLVMAYAGVSLFGRSKHVSDFVKQVVNPIYCISLSILISFSETHCLRR